MSLKTMWQEMAEAFVNKDDEKVKNLENYYMGVLNDFNEVQMDESWSQAKEGIKQEMVNQQNYPMNTANQYRDHSTPHRVFLESLQKGDMQQSILSLEAHLQKNPSDHQGWRMLGQLMQENDKDRESTKALLKALELDQDCKGTLLQLGIACTNVFDTVTSMMYLEKWLQVAS